jgi:hypothetical protein
MWTVLGWLIFFLLLHIVDKRYKYLQQRAQNELEQAFAVGQRAQPLLWVWLGVSGAAVAGFVSSRALGFDGLYGSLGAALLTLAYFERRRYPKLLITTGPHGTQVAFEDLHAVTIAIDEKSRVFFDGSCLELQVEGSPKRIVLACHDFPEVDFHALWQWLTNVQRDRVAPARGRVAAIGGFRAPGGLSNLLFLREEKSLRPLLLCLWIGFLILGMKRVFE